MILRLLGNKTIQFNTRGKKSDPAIQKQLNIDMKFTIKLNFFFKYMTIFIYFNIYEYIYIFYLICRVFPFQFFIF